MHDTPANLLAGFLVGVMVAFLVLLAFRWPC